VAGTGVVLSPGQSVPGTSDTGLRVEAEGDVASLSFVAADPVTWSAGEHLLLRVYGGRVNGTALRIRSAAGGTPVVVTAPADQWTSFSVVLPVVGDSVASIVVDVAQDLVPRTYRFFLDGVVLSSS
jgi:hypothetical protein